MELVVLGVFIYLFMAIGFGRWLWKRWRDWKRERWLLDLPYMLSGKPVEIALERFGPPFDVFSGSARTLYEWKSPPSEAFPPGTGLLIVYVVSDSAGLVIEIRWLTRGE